jgi:hypothetical protein
MADYSTTYTLTTPGGTIIFNNGELGGGSLDNLYWIGNVQGLDGPTLRVPVDDTPFGHGGIVHRSWKGPRHPIIEGSLVVQSVPFGSPGCQELLNAMEAALNAALDSILAPTSGTLAWTPSGGTPKSLTVFYEVSLDIEPENGYATRSFNFGLVSESADL